MSGSSPSGSGRARPIEGVVLRPLAPHEDRRGSFTEVFCDHWSLPVAPAQWSLVRSRERVLRGMYLHRNHDEYVLVLEGRALVGIHDPREASPSFGASATYELRGGEPACLCFPRGVVHGWYFPVPSVHLQAVSESYDAYHPHDNLSIRWDDPSWASTGPIRPPSSPSARRASACCGTC